MIRDSTNTPGNSQTDFNVVTLTATTSVVTPLVEAGTGGTTLTVASGPSNDILLRTRDADTTLRTQVIINFVAGTDQPLTLQGGNGSAPQILGSTNGLILDSSASTLVLKGAGTTAITITGANVVGSGSFTSAAPAGGTAGAWKFGVAAVVSPTSPNRTIELDVGGTIYYIHAKTTNN